MQGFLEEVVAYVLEKYADISGEVCLVTPNRRAGLFLRKYLSAKVTKPLWAPSFLSIEDFVNRISGCQVVDNLSLMFHFYQVYRNIEKDKADNIEDFLRWGSVLLRDFDEIDAALDNPDTLFENLKDIKNIEAWNPDGTLQDDFQKKYLSFFSKFQDYHKKLINYLDQKNLAYQGMSYRKAARRLYANPQSLPWKKVIFVGFNALNQAEETIINSLVQFGIAEILSDTDPYYEDNPKHEAGNFIRKYRKKWNVPKDDDRQSGFARGKEIKIMGIARQLNQAQLAGNILSNNNNLTLDEQTAVVLANENLLIPVLNALPEKAAAINITMGYPLSKTNLFGFFEALFQLYLTAARLDPSSREKAPSFYYKDLLRFFSNSCTALLWDIHRGKEKLEKLIRKISFSNKSFYSFEELICLGEDNWGWKEAFNFLSQNWIAVQKGIVPSLLEISERLDQAFREKAEKSFGTLQQSPFFIDFEALYYSGRIFSRLNSLIDGEEGLNNIRTLWQVIRLMVLETRIAFTGEPIEGLQVMGMLETRNLNFRNIILLSVNEGVLPKGKISGSFIPFDVRKEFGLQIHSDKDSVYSYHFYRLLQRAEQVFLIYDTESDGMGSGEKSRFITQLEYELPDFNPNIKIENQLISLSPTIKTGSRQISIPKTPEILERLQEMTNHGFSPSSLNVFIQCPLKFYLEKVLRLSEAEGVEETIDATTLGNVVHGVLEELYRPLKDSVISPEILEEMTPQIDTLTINNFKKHYPQGEISSGKNLLLFNLAKRHVENFLKTEAQTLKHNIQQNRHLTLMDVEVILNGSLSMNLNEEPITVKIRGKADRIDRLGNTIRIIDYKTGKIERSSLNVRDLNEIIEDPSFDKVFQLLIYAWLYKQGHPTEENVEAGIFSMRNLSEGFLKSKLDPSILKEIIDPEVAFLEQLKSLILKIMDPAQPFSQAQKVENCKYCYFRALCERFEDQSG